MFPIIVNRVNFRVVEFLANPTTGALKTAGVVRLRIFEYVEGANFNIYDWDDDTFKAGAPVTAFETCTHRTAGAVDTGLWESEVISIAAFTSGRRYVFQFEDVADTVFNSWETQREGLFGSEPVELKMMASGTGNVFQVGAWVEENGWRSTAVTALNNVELRDATGALVLDLGNNNTPTADGVFAFAGDYTQVQANTLYYLRAEVVRTGLTTFVAQTGLTRLG